MCNIAPQLRIHQVFPLTRFRLNRSRVCLLALSVLLAGCGSGSSPAPTTNTTPTPPSSGGGALNQPNAVSVGGGGAVSNINIAVPAPAGTPPNAQVLGVAALSNSGGTAQNTGAQIHRGTAMHVLIFGPGLGGNMQVRLSGPADYSISNIQSITSTDNTPGIEFDVSMGGAAALGGRTVILIDPNNNATTFTGGLEVIP